MKYRSSAASFALAVVTVLGLVGPVAAGDQVLFRGILDGDVIITPLVPPFVSALVEGTGHATKLGATVRRGQPHDHRFLRGDHLLRRCAQALNQRGR